MRAALVHRSVAFQSEGASRGVQNSTFASTRSWKRAIVRASSATLARVQAQRGCAKRSSVARSALPATVDSAGHRSGARSFPAAGVLLYFHTIANPPVTAASHPAAAIHASLEASLDLSEAGARVMQDESLRTFLT